MNAQNIPLWTGEFVKRMHLAGIQKKSIALKLGYSKEYVGRVLSGKEAPKGAEGRFNAALEALIEEKERVGDGTVVK